LASPWFGALIAVTFLSVPLGLGSPWFGALILGTILSVPLGLASPWFGTLNAGPSGSERWFWKNIQFIWRSEGFCGAGLVALLV
ncbi:unnamed protein product, partial [Rotaria socialis]